MVQPVGPAHAQTSPEPDPRDQGADRDWSEGLGLLQEGARRLLRGLMQEMEPALRDLGTRIDDLSVYHRPELLPNGDIIIRRRVPLESEPVSPPELPREGEIDI
ncbi:hypothetical protein [Plastorhodobacter daqingensis]